MWGAPIVTNGSLWRCSTKVREPSELRFAVVRGVGRGIGGNAACSQITLDNLVMLFLCVRAYYCYSYYQ